jgi:hypothetical protein
MGLRRRGRRRRGLRPAAPWEEEGGCGVRRRGRRRSGLRPAAPWQEETGAAPVAPWEEEEARLEEARLEEEGAATCKRRWGKGAAGVGLVRVRGLFIYMCLRLM